MFSATRYEDTSTIFVPIEYLHGVEGGARECMYRHTFNLLYRNWIADRLANREPSPEEAQIFSHLLVTQARFNIDLCPQALAACLARDKEFLEFFIDHENRAPDFEFEFRM